MDGKTGASVFSVFWASTVIRDTANPFITNVAADGSLRKPKYC